MLTVFGSLYTEIAMCVDAVPGEDEVVLGRDHAMRSGGKGANQALAALRAGARVALVGMVGDDDNGKRARTDLRRAGVITSGVGVADEYATGVACLIHEAGRQRRTIVCPGANQLASCDQVPVEILGKNCYVLVQMATPPEETYAVLRKARANGAVTILNPAPAAALPEAIFDDVDYLVLNHLEAQQLSGLLGIDAEMKDATDMAYAIAARGQCVCSITCGVEGAVAVYPDGTGWRADAPGLNQDEPVDVSSCGDAYAGTLAACLKNGMRLDKAMNYASAAGALTCMHAAFPYWADIETFCSKLAAPEAIELA